MAVKFTSYRRQFQERFEAATAEGLQRAGIHYHNACRTAVSRANPRNSSTGQYDSPSKPGEPPRARTGFGRDNVVYEYNDKQSDPAVRVGITANAIYMFHLEHGFSVPAHTIVPKSRQFLKLPWRGPVAQQAMLNKINRAPKVMGRTKSGAKKFLALPPNGKPFTVYADHGSSGNYYYFVKRANVKGFIVAPRPWMMPTLERERPRLALLAATGGKSQIP